MVVPRPCGGVSRVRAVLVAIGEARLIRPTSCMEAGAAIQGLAFLEVASAGLDVPPSSAGLRQYVP